MEQTTERKKQNAYSNRSTGVDLVNMVYGKVPPQATNLEMAVLGAIMMEKSALDRVVSILKPESFYNDRHTRVYEAMLQLNSKSQPIDILMVTEQLKTNENLELVGGEFYLTELTRTVVSGAHIEAHAIIIYKKFLAREIIRTSGDLISLAYDDTSDGLELLNHAETAFTDISASHVFGEMVGIDSVLVQAMQKIEEWRKLDSPITGVPSGFKKLDQATRGFQNGDLIIVAARPSVGKTALALSIIRSAAEKVPVAVWSLEMKAVMLVLRMMSAESKELLHAIQTGRLSDEQMMNIYKKAVQKLSGLGIFFDDLAGLTIPKLRSKCRRMKRKGKLGMVVIDYLQLMGSDEKKQNREQEVSNISRALKSLAQELDIPIIALSQLSREIEKRSNRTPILADIRESGAIEQDADVVMFLYGPSDEEISQDAALQNRRFLKIAKQRNGFLVNVDLDFKDEIQFFSEVSQLPTISAPGNWRPVVKDN